MNEIRSEFVFTMVPEWVMRAPISSHAVRLYCALGRFANLPHGAVPSRQTLADEWMNGSSTDTVDRAKDELVKIGALTVEARSGETNRYLLKQTTPTTLRTGADIPSARVPTERKTGKKDSNESKDRSRASSQLRDPIWDALVAVFGPAETETARKLRGKTVRSLLGAGALPEDVLAAPERFHERMPAGTTLTETALEKHWGLLLQPIDRINGTKRPGRGGVSLEDVRSL